MPKSHESMWYPDSSAASSETLESIINSNISAPEDVQAQKVNETLKEVNQVFIQ